MKAILAILLVIAGFAAGAWWKGRAPAPTPATGTRKILYWVDPMHPAYKSDKPGIAPDCGMQLTPVYEDSGPAPSAKGRILHYVDPEAPAYKAQAPGLNPETGNELKPVYEGEGATIPAGVIQVPTDKLQFLNVRFGTAEISSTSRTIRAVGRVTTDETRVEHQHTRVEGWIDKVYVDFTGKEVRHGQALLTIYSPEMLATQQEYLLAIKGRDQLKGSTLPGAHDHMIHLIEAARRRLSRWDFTDDQIAEITRTGQPIQTFTLYAHANGVVMMRNAFPHQQVKPDMELYTIADLSRVWIIADVFESDAPEIRIGTPAHITAAYDPNLAFDAKVSYILPQIDAATRTLKVRLEAPNPGLRLKPEMFVDVDFRIGTAPRLTVPSEAVLDAGDRKTVFVDRGNGAFEPRAVETGEHIEDRVVILKGLRAGERIVISGNFLLDSESQMKAAQHD